MQLNVAAEVMLGVLHGADARFDHVHTDTRTLNSVALFFALRGEHFDGHAYLRAAKKAGAVAAVVDSFDAGIALPQIVVTDTVAALGLLAGYWRKQFKGIVIGVTGSSGKTTVKGLLREIFSGFTSVHATAGNLNNHIGVPLTLLGLAEQSVAVVEMGTNHPGEIAYLAQMARPDVALVNNVMPAHIEGFGNLEAIAQEKGAIYSYLLPSQTAIINLQDEFAQQFLNQTKHCLQLGFGESNKAEVPSVTAENIRLNTQGCPEFELHLPNGTSSPVQMTLPGLHNVHNALAAAACAWTAGCPLKEIANGLQRFTGDKGRMQLKIGKAQARIIDDTYNANPGSVKAAIQYLSACPNDRILVLGNMGELGDICDSAHTEIGEFARAHHITALYCVGDKAALAAQSFGEGAYAFSSQAELIQNICRKLTATTTVLIKGSRSAQMEHVVDALCHEEQELC